MRPTPDYRVNSEVQIDPEVSLRCRIRYQTTLLTQMWTLPDRYRKFELLGCCDASGPRLSRDIIHRHIMALTSQVLTSVIVVMA